MNKRSEPRPHGGEHTTVDPPASPPTGRWGELLRHDLPASLVVFLVAVPLSLGIAAATGAPIMAGLIAAVVGGVVAGAFAGAPLQVSGPAAGLVVIVASLIERHGWPVTAAITVGAGLLQLLFGVSKVARLALSLSPAVVHGMLAGIGVVIAIGQAQVMLGGQSRPEALENLDAMPEVLTGLHTPTLLIGLAAVVVLIAWPRLPVLRAVPAPLAAVAIATLLAMGSPDVVTVSLPDDPLGAISLPALPDSDLLAVGVGVLTVALVASVESLLSAVAVDRMHDGPRADLNRELLAQGAANIGSGSLGGLPITGVIVRSSTNVSSGARTRASSILHGVWVAGAVLFLGALLEMIPLTALAAVLIVVGVKLVDPARMRLLWRQREFLPYAVTMAGVVCFDLVVGVLAGLALAMVQTLWRLARHSIQVVPLGDDRWRVTVGGSLVFLGVSSLTSRLNTVPAGQDVTVELHLDCLDQGAFEALRDWRVGYERAGGTVRVDEIGAAWYHRAVRGGRPATSRSSTALAPHWFAPWQHWQRHRDQRTDIESAIPRQRDEADPMILGVQEFERRSAPLLRPLLAELAEHGQRPARLFVCCADSRMVPNVITTSGPGDLFTLRNVGNLVPPSDSLGDSSVGSAVEFAVERLAVTSIVVCGHSHCGAMRSLLEDDMNPSSHLADWLVHAEPSLRRFRSLPPSDAGQDEGAGSAADSVAVINVRQQLTNLMTYPLVREAVLAGRLTLAGMYFDLAEARMYLVDEHDGTLRALSEPLGQV
ncbi:MULTISPECIES: SulP family inorganic anion transporter [Actinoalloteichus]|uniref:carbonic anhydrase n=1 Tax=Actinoalloteichus fjordicus TaxID=1612552 RepID=A0AAC9PTQ9_9PSEU|nr:MULTISPECIES: bifunctional SulP family inorganic anion transporter/carbonic anhydrase [Actinoalloteichus]APU16280.1 sulfate permease-like transporter, MFS superfamily [Actinoalloteichus fjordicus]APU22340.1 sulfate permease-like transporter, MFS superfamily [Actinoalloteichus sp. GBA129-24]